MGPSAKNRRKENVMKWNASKLMGVCLAWTLGAFGSALADTGSVEIHLTDDRGAPIAGAIVSLQGGEGAVPGATVITDSMGRATLTAEEGRTALLIEHDGKRKKIVVMIPPGDTLRRDVELERPSAPPGTDGDPGPGIRVRAGAARIETPGGSGAIGTLVLATEIGLRFSPEVLNGTTFDVEVEPPPEVQLGSSPWRWTFGLTRQQADDTSQTSVAPGSNPVAFTYWRPAATNKSTGLFLGTAGADAFVSTDFEMHRFSVQLQRARPATRLRARPFFGVRVARAEQEIAGSFTSPTFTGAAEVSGRIDETITDDRVSLPVGFQADYPMPGRASFHWGGYLAPGYQRTNLAGTQTTTCLVCAVDEAQLEFAIDETSSSFSMSGGIFAGFGFDVSNKLSLQLRSTYDHVSRLGVSSNPQNPSQAEAHLETGDAGSWRVELGLGGRF